MPEVMFCLIHVQRGEMYALKARDKYYKREKEREDEYREGRRARAREQHTHHNRLEGGVRVHTRWGGGAKHMLSIPLSKIGQMPSLPFHLL